MDVLAASKKFTVLLILNLSSILGSAALAQSSSNGLNRVSITVTGDSLSYGISVRGYDLSSNNCGREFNNLMKYINGEKYLFISDTISFVMVVSEWIDNLDSTRQTVRIYPTTIQETFKADKGPDYLVNSSDFAYIVTTDFPTRYTKSYIGKLQKYAYTDSKFYLTFKGLHQKDFVAELSFYNGQFKCNFHELNQLPR